VGYAGGTTRNPTYHDLGDHTETVQIDYDPHLVSYSELLDIFWRSHDASHRSWSQQYKSAVFYHNEEQKMIALETRDREASRKSRAIFTEIVPFTGFTLAEDYHQKYGLRHETGLMREFRAMYPDEERFVASTAAARVNGYLDGYGTLAALKAEVNRLGLSTQGSKTLLDIVASGTSSRGCPL
jgi:methionine-S-sulfoxide reductase